MLASIFSELSWPSWLGTPSQVALLVIVVVTLIKTWPIIQKNLLDAEDRRASRYSQRITDLEAAVKACQEECEEHKTSLRNELRSLEEKRLGDRHQHLQEQISLVSVLVKNVDNPLLAHVLEQLQATKRTLPFQLTGVVGDTQGDDAK